MANNVNDYGTLSPRTQAFAVAKLLKRSQLDLVFERFGQIDPQPKNKSLTRKWRRYNSFAPATSPVAEGITPPGEKLTYTDVVATLEQYGAVHETTDVVVDTHEDPILEVMMELCGEQAAQTLELIRFYILRAGTNVFFANNVAGRGYVASPATRADFRKVVRAFKRNRAAEISKIISATPNVATEPVAPAYFAVMHTDNADDVRGLTGFVPIEKYADSTKALPGEIGKLESIRFVTCSLLTSWQAVGAATTTMLRNGATPGSSLACDVYPILVFAKDAYGIVPLQGKEAVEVSVINPGKKEKSDVLGQRGYAGWLMYQTAAILDENRMARIEVACTANPA